MGDAPEATRGGKSKAERRRIRQKERRRLAAAQHGHDDEVDELLDFEPLDGGAGEAGEDHYTGAP